nr:hypothetical protein [Chroococcidiopsis sp. CCALA 051]
MTNDQLPIIKEIIMDLQGKKRIEAVLAIAGYAASGGAVSALPSPGVEMPKQFVLTAADIGMYTLIWKIYFEEDLSQKNLLEILAELGMVTIGAVGTAYVVAKVSTAILNEINDWLGPVGWGVKAAIAGSLSSLFGLGWMLYCDRLYSQKEVAF